MIKIHNPSHPGTILKELYLDGAGINVTQAADVLGISRKTLSLIVNGHAPISTQTAIMLAQAFPNTTPQLWLNLQVKYDLWQATQKPIKKIPPLWGSTDD